MSEASNSNANQVPGLEFTTRQNGDVIPDDVIAELARRMRFASSPGGGAGGALSIGFGGSTVSDASGNQLVSNANGLFVGLGAGLGVQTGNGLTLTADNKIKLDGHRGFAQRHSITANGTKTFTLPEQLTAYAVAITAYGPPGSARWYVSDKNSTAVTVTITDYSVTFDLDIYAIELT